MMTAAVYLQFWATSRRVIARASSTGAKQGSSVDVGGGRWFGVCEGVLMMFVVSESDDDGERH